MHTATTMGGATESGDTQMTEIHQLAYLTAERMVPWKCLSLQATVGRTSAFVPVAYASTSKAFFSHWAEGSGSKPRAVLWVVSCPAYRQGKGPRLAFPPTLTAKLVVEDVLTGAEVAQWADDRDASLTVPGREQKEEFDAWRRAESVRGRECRAVFRITRDFARAARAAASKRHKRISDEQAWSQVRTAVANRDRSCFLAHVDATKLLSSVLALPGLGRLSMPQRAARVGPHLRGPRYIDAADERCMNELARLVEAGTNDTVFLNYRRNAHVGDVTKIANRLLAKGRGVWLDGVSIPEFEGQPAWRSRRRIRRKDPPSVELEDLLERAIASSSLFLCLAADDYLKPPDDGGRMENWAVRELAYASWRTRVRDGARIQLVDLGNVPDELKRSYPKRWTCKNKPVAIADRVDQLLG
jgi:hypothetical protein